MPGLLDGRVAVLPLPAFPGTVGVSRRPTGRGAVIRSAAGTVIRKPVAYVLAVSRPTRVFHR